MDARKLVAVTIVCSALGPVRADDPVLSHAIAIHAAAVESIHTLSGRVTTTLLPADQTVPKTVYEGECWRTPDLLRVRQRGQRGGGEEVIDFLLRDGVQRAVIKRPAPGGRGSGVTLLVTPEGRPVVSTNIWRIGMLCVPFFDSETKPFVPLRTAVARTPVGPAAEEGGPRGRHVRFTMTEDARTESDVWLDRTANYLISKFVRRTAAAGELLGSRVEYAVESFTEPQPGVFFPARVVVKSYVSGALTVTQEMVISDVKVNAGRPTLPDKLPIVAGMVATDEVRGTQYKVDADGNPAGDISTLRYTPASTVAAPPAADGPLDGWLGSPTAWLFALSAVFAVAAVIKVYRRRSRPQAA